MTLMTHLLQPITISIQAPVLKKISHHRTSFIIHQRKYHTYFGPDRTIKANNDSKLSNRKSSPKHILQSYRSSSLQKTPPQLVSMQTYA